MHGKNSTLIVIVLTIVACMEDTKTTRSLATPMIDRSEQEDIKGETSDLVRNSEELGENTIENDVLEWVYIPSLGGYQLARTEVTVAQYRTCVEAAWCTQPTKYDPNNSLNKKCNWKRPDHENHPINCVDWHQAMAFSEWVGGRLPTEDEWYAEASNNGAWEYPWGNEEFNCDLAVCWGEPRCNCEDTCPVCSRPNGNSVSGLCDMAGNVWEWTSTQEGRYRVFRGGAWDFDAEYCRAAFRDGDVPSSRDYDIGFRPLRFKP